MKAVIDARETLIYGIGTPLMQLRWIINLFKGATFIYVLSLIYLYGSCTSLWLYLALHGSYGIIWIYKDITFGDKSWTREGPAFTLIAMVIVLTLYWMTPFLIAIGMGIQEPQIERQVICVGMYVVGIFLMIGSDYQKNNQLKVKPGLITNGFFARTRNPNYLGEMLIYGSFAAVGGHIYSYLYLAFIWSTLFLLNIIAKDYSFSKKEGWTEYKRNSGILLPRIIGWVDYLVYPGLIYVLYKAYESA